MPFDTSGNFTRDYNWVDDRNAGIKIEAIRMDDEFDNYAAAINQTMLRTGITPMLGNLNMQGNSIYGIAGGTLALPGLRFINDQSTGIGSFNPGEVSITSNGVEMLRTTAAGAIVGGELGTVGDAIIGGNVNAGGDVACGAVMINGAAATTRTLSYQTHGVQRWVLFADSTAESGANVGSDFYIQRNADNGQYIDKPLEISRATGLVTLTGPGGLKVQQLGGGGTISSLVMDCQPTTNGRNINYTTNGLSRWSLQSPCGNETGSNVGSDFAIRRFTDAGVSIDFPLTINRGNGLVTLGSPGGLLVTGPTTHSGMVYFNYNMSSVLPPVGGGALGWNYTSGSGEVDFFNAFLTAGISFQFYQMTSASARTLLLQLAPSGANIYTNFNVNGALGVTGAFSAASAGITGTLNVTGVVSVGGSLNVTNTAIINGPAATHRQVLYETSGVSRWAIDCENTAESGSQAGSNLFFNRFTDAGAYIDTPMYITRSNGGVVIQGAGLTITSALTVNGAASVQGLTVYNAIYVTGTPTITVNGTPNTNRTVNFATNNANRWTINGATSDAESGSNVGSNFYIQRWTDAGAYIDNPITIIRSTGLVQTSTHLNVGGNIAVYGGVATITNNAGATLNLQGANGAGKQIYFLTGATARWQIYCTGFSETGGNVGSDLGIARYNDAGAVLDYPFSIVRSTGQTSIQGAGGLNVTTGITANSLTVSGTIQATGPTAAVSVNAGTAQAIFNANGGNGTVRGLYIYTGGLQRWRVYADTTAESSNSGSHLNFSRHNDAGTYLDTPLQIQRQTGQAIFTVAIVNGSDVRMKKNIKPLKNGLDIIERLNGVYFKSKAKGMEDKRQVGLVAQDVIEVLPEIVFEGDDENKMLGIAYSPLVAVLVEAVKELSARVRELEAAKA